MKNSQPTFLELHNEGRSAYELVLGGMLGGYLGLTISRHGLSGGSYADLGLLLIWCCAFVLCLNSSMDRFHRRNWTWAGYYALTALVATALAADVAPKMNVDQTILLTIFAVWWIFGAVEFASAGYAMWARK